jgi:NADP-dependent 3-hydroxy acid dehydrogenase YdfG
MTSKTGPIALVTGASSGIGEAAARELAAAGFTVYGTSRKAAAGEEREGIAFLPLDVTDDDSVAAAVREVLDRSGRIDVLVNNAGLGLAGAAEESSIEQARALFETNLFGAIRMTRAVLPQMREQGSGRVINVSSVQGLVPAPFGALYAATSTRSRAIRSRWITRYASTASESSSSSPPTPAPRSTRTRSRPTSPCRSTRNAARSVTD